jgi:hypothetical protein
VPNPIDDAFVHALEDQNAEMRRAGVRGTDARSMAKFHERHQAGNLVAGLVAAISGYDSNRAKPHRQMAIARTMKAGFSPWEEMLLDKTAPWAQVVTPRCRRACRQILKDSSAHIPYV